MTGFLAKNSLLHPQILRIGTLKNPVNWQVLEYNASDARGQKIIQVTWQICREADAVVWCESKAAKESHSRFSN